MAPRRGGSDSGDMSGGIQLEDTMKLTGVTGEYRSSYTACAFIHGILAVCFLIIFITSYIIRQQKWRKARESSFMWSIIFSAFFSFLASSLFLASYVCELYEATVFESWVLIHPWGHTFSFIAALTLITAMYSILHNRMRTVISKSSAAMIRSINWFLFAVYVLLVLAWLAAGVWSVWGLLLKDIKDGYAYDYLGPRLKNFMDTNFFLIHVLNIAAAGVVWQFVIQVWLIIVGIIVLSKTRKPGVSSDRTRKATAVFVYGGLVLYIINTLTALIVFFEFWDLTSIPVWLRSIEAGIEGFVQVITMAALCIFAAMMAPVDAPGQWNLGTRKYAGRLDRSGRAVRNRKEPLVIAGALHV